MPAGIRIDIHLGGFRDSEEKPDRSKSRLQKIAMRLSEEIERVLKEQTNVVMDEEEHSLTASDMVKVHVNDGLGLAWPPEGQSSNPEPIGDGISKYLEQLEAGKIQRTLMPLETYDDGSFHIFISADLR